MLNYKDRVLIIPHCHCSWFLGGNWIWNGSCPLYATTLHKCPNTDWTGGSCPLPAPENVPSQRSPNWSLKMLPKPQSCGLFWYLITEQSTLPNPALAQTLLSSLHVQCKDFITSISPPFQLNRDRSTACASLCFFLCQHQFKTFPLRCG